MWVFVGAARSAAWGPCWAVKHGSVPSGKASEQGRAGVASCVVPSQWCQDHVVQLCTSLTNVDSARHHRIMHKLAHMASQPQAKSPHQQLEYRINSCSSHPMESSSVARQSNCCCIPMPAWCKHKGVSSCRMSHAWWRTGLCMLQMSDWEKRPLSSRQLEYAALDAFVLLQIFNVISNRQTGLSQAQLQSCLHSYPAQRPQSSPRKPSPRKLPADAHPLSQLPSGRQPSSQESTPATLPVSSISGASTKSNHPSLSNTHSARLLHSQAAGDSSSAATVAVPWQGCAEQSETGGSSGVADGSSLQECLESHGLQCALRTHSSLGAG